MKHSIKQKQRKVHFQVIEWFELRLDRIFTIIKYWLIRS